MKTTLKAVYDRLGRPSLRRLALVLGLLAAVGFVTIAYLGDARLVSALSLLMSLVTIAAAAAAWREARKARAAVRVSNDRAEVTYRRILAAIEVERLAAERRHAQSLVPMQEQSP